MLADGTKELVALDEGGRASEQSGCEMLVRLRGHQGLATGPKLAIGDGALDFWNALGKVYPGPRGQRCWVHKTANVLNKLPKRSRSKPTPRA